MSLCCCSSASVAGLPAAARRGLLPGRWWCCVCWAYVACRMWPPSVARWQKWAIQVSQKCATVFEGHARSSVSASPVSLDFDGSVISTMVMPKGTAVGYNPKKKGARSYYNLFCTVAQTGQFLDVLHRPGNVHDSKDAHAFMMAPSIGARRVGAHRGVWTAPSSANTRSLSWTCMASPRSVSLSNAFPYSRTRSKRAGAGATSMKLLLFRE